MVLWATILILQGASLVGSSTGIPGVPENITVMFLNPTSVRVSWSTSQVEQVEKYDVTYKPTDARSHNNSYRVVAVVAGNSEAVTLSNLRADTQYQLVVTAVKSGKKLRSRPIVFRTLEPPRTSPQQDSAVTGVPIPPPPPPPGSGPQPETYIQIRGVEVGIVLLVLMVWVGAIALFFNRWGKIRMLLPYQPDYKSEQLKVPGAGACASANAPYTHSSSQHVCSQEFLRRHGSTSRLCRKVRSADNLPLASSNRQNSDPREDGSQEEADRETFLKANQDDSDKSDDAETRENSLDNPRNDSLIDTSPLQHQSSRCCRHSCELTGCSCRGACHHVHHHHHQQQQPQHHRGTRSCDYERLRRTTEPSIEPLLPPSQQSQQPQQHFGLPILSVSEPSPPDEVERADDYL